MIGFDSEIIDLFNPVNQDHPLNQGRVALWMAVNGLSGGPTFQDLTGLHPGALTGMTTSASGWRGTTRPGGYGHLVFDGTNDYVDIADVPALQPTSVTVSCWFRCDGTISTERVLVSNFYAGGFYLEIFQSKVGCGINNDEAQGTTVLTAGVWHHILGTYDGATIKVYLNGVLEGSTASTPPINYAAGNLAIGHYTGNGLLWFAGAIDAVSLWSRALTANEIEAEYAQSRCGYPGVLNRLPRPVTLLFTTGVPPTPPPPAVQPGIVEITTSAQKLSARTHRLSGHTENPSELYYYRDGNWTLFPIQPLSGPATGLELTQTYKQPSTLAFTLPDPQGLYAAENRNSAYNLNAAGDYDALLDEARKIMLRVGTKCYTNLASGITPTTSVAIGLGSLAKLTDGKFTDWTGGTPFDAGAAWSISGTAPTVDVTLDLGASSWIRHVAIRFGTRVGGFTLPVSVTVQLSSDGSVWRSWPVRPVGGTSPDWAESHSGQAVEEAFCDLDTAARYVRFHVLGIDGSTSLGIDEIAVYGGNAFTTLGANLFTGYMGDQIEFTPQGQIQCVAVDVLKRLADNNDVFLTAAYRLTSAGGTELADIAYSLLTSSAYWRSVETNGYDAPFTAAEIGWLSGSGLTGLRYPLWQGQTNSILGYCLELFNTIGWNFYADGNGVLRATDPPTAQRLPDRVCIAASDGNYDVRDCKRHRTGKNMRNNVIVQTGKSDSTGSGTITLFEPNSIARFGTRTTRITDPLASTTYLRKRVAEYFLRDYAWNLQTLTNTIRPQFETTLKQIFGFRAPARPNLFSAKSTVAGDLRSQELWSLVSLKHNICYGKWEAEAEWIPYVAKLADAPNFTALNTIGGDPTELDAVFDPITDPTVVSIRVYTSLTSAFSGFTVKTTFSPPTLTHFIIPSLSTGVPVWVYLTAVDQDGNESIPSHVLTAIPGSSSQSITCYTITDFTVGSILTQGPDSQGYYTYQFLGLWTAPACGFTQDDVRAYVEPVPGAGPPSSPDTPGSWPVHNDNFNWWAPNRILAGLTWDNATPGQLDFVFTFRSKSALAGKRMYWIIYNSARTRAWIPVRGNFTSCIVAAP